MNKKVLKALEYNKILEKTSAFAATADAKSNILSLVPSFEFDEVKLSLELTSQAMSMIAMHGGLPAAPLKNITAAMKRCEMGGTLSLAELMNIGSLLRMSRQILKYMDDADRFPLLTDISGRLSIHRDLERDITDSIINEETLADSASGELGALRRQAGRLQAKIKDVLNGMLSSAAKYLQDPIITMRGDRYVLPVKSEHKSAVPGIVHDSSSTGATLFIEPAAAVEINNKLRELAVAEKREIERIIAEFSARVGEVSELLLENYNAIITLDILFSKASFGRSIRANIPILNEEKYLSIKSARHPLISADKVVPVSIYLGKDFDTLVITGPNTGGKTVTLKTVGLFALMCQSGFAIPAEIGSCMPVYTNIFADIGDEQSIEQSLSTFSAHMVNIVDILNNIQPGALALFDELGAGTDPDEGAALAIEILEYIKSMGAITLATTHYSELKLYAVSAPRVENASCEFDVATLKPTYRLLIGVPGKSNAFAISKRLGLYDSIIEKAGARMSSESVRFEDIITELQSKREEARAAYEEAQELKAQSAKLKSELKNASSELEKKRQGIIDNARREAKEIIERANDETDELIKEIRKLSKEITNADSLEEMRKLREELRKKSNDNNVSLKNEYVKSKTRIEDIKLGMEVEILSMQETGTVASLPNKSGDLQVQIGIMKTKVNVSEVKIIKDTSHKKMGQKILSGRSGVASKSMSIKTELDLRGMYAYDATVTVDKFIDDAVLSSLKTFSIIHGKGTGALKKAVHDLLKQNKAVKSYRLGGLGEGDTGVTIVELK